MNRKIVGLAGPAGCGKDTVAALLVQYGYTRYGFADPLKAALAALGLAEPERARKEDILPGRNYSYRVAAQTLGTEWARGLDIEFWLNLAKQKVANLGDTVISDVRFPNEAEWVRSEGGSVWHIGGRSTTISGAAALHASETPVDFVHGTDVRVSNQGSMETLGHIVATLVGKNYETSR